MHLCYYNICSDYCFQDLYWVIHSDKQTETMPNNLGTLAHFIDISTGYLICTEKYVIKLYSKIPVS